MRSGVQDRLLGAAGAAIVVALLGYLLIAGLTVEMQIRRQQAATVIDLPSLPRPQRQPRPPVDRPKARKASGRASPRNLRNKAAEVVVPVPLVLPPAPPILLSAPTAGAGMASSAGASDRPGPGTGAGGEGDGSGGGGDGDGDGGGGVPPRLIKGRLKFSNLPEDLREAGIGGTVGVRYRVDVDGRASDCRITASSGSRELDEATCQLIEERFLFDPARDAADRPVRSILEENHSWIVRHDDDRRSAP